jgi:hypothetical protein
VSDVRRPYVEGYGVREGKCRQRAGKPIAIVVHTTGSGPAARANPSLDKSRQFEKWRRRNPADAETTFTAALWVFTQASPDSGHYLVGQGGECVQVVPETLVARHVGASGSKAYASPGWGTDEHEWWRERWPGLTSPLQLAGGALWRGGSCNGATVGIEVAPPIDDPRGPWSDECWREIGKLIGEVCLAYDIPCTRTYVVTHSCAHPIARTAKGKPYDPPISQFSWERFAQMTGAPF